MHPSLEVEEEAASLNHLYPGQGPQGKSKHFREVKSVCRMQQIGEHKGEAKGAFVWHKQWDKESRNFPMRKTGKGQ